MQQAWSVSATASASPQKRRPPSPLLRLVYANPPHPTGSSAYPPTVDIPAIACSGFRSSIESAPPAPHPIPPELQSSLLASPGLVTSVRHHPAAAELLHPDCRMAAPPPAAAVGGVQDSHWFSLYDIPGGDGGELLPPKPPAQPRGPMSPAQPAPDAVQSSAMRAPGAPLDSHWTSSSWAQSAQPLPPPRLSWPPGRDASFMFTVRTRRHHQHGQHACSSSWDSGGGGDRVVGHDDDSGPRLKLNLSGAVSHPGLTSAREATLPHLEMPCTDAGNGGGGGGGGGGGSVAEFAEADVGSGGEHTSIRNADDSDSGGGSGRRALLPRLTDIWTRTAAAAAVTSTAMPAVGHSTPAAEPKAHPDAPAAAYPGAHGQMPNKEDDVVDDEGGERNAQRKHHSAAARADAGTALADAPQVTPLFSDAVVHSSDSPAPSVSAVRTIAQGEDTEAAHKAGGGGGREDAKPTSGTTASLGPAIATAPAAPATAGGVVTGQGLVRDPAEPYKVCAAAAAAAVSTAAAGPTHGSLPQPVPVQVASRRKRRLEGPGGGRAGRGAKDGVTRGAVGLFHPQLYLSGGNCIECGNEMMSRGKFERLAGTATAKWHVSIKVLPSGVTLGKWLQQHGLPILQGRPRKRPPLEHVEVAAENSEADGTDEDLSGSLTSVPSATHLNTAPSPPADPEDPPGSNRAMQEFILQEKGQGAQAVHEAGEGFGLQLRVAPAVDAGQIRADPARLNMYGSGGEGSCNRYMLSWPNLLGTPRSRAALATATATATGASGKGLPQLAGAVAPSVLQPTFDTGPQGLSGLTEEPQSLQAGPGRSALGITPYISGGDGGCVPLGPMDLNWNSGRAVGGPVQAEGDSLPRPFQPLPQLQLQLLQRPEDSALARPAYAAPQHSAETPYTRTELWNKATAGAHPAAHFLPDADYGASPDSRASSSSDKTPARMESVTVTTATTAITATTAAVVNGGSFWLGEASGSGGDGGGGGYADRTAATASAHDAPTSAYLLFDRGRGGSSRSNVPYSSRDLPENLYEQFDLASSASESAAAPQMFTLMRTDNRASNPVFNASARVNTNTNTNTNSAAGSRGLTSPGSSRLLLTSFSSGTLTWPGGLTCSAAPTPAATQGGSVSAHRAQWGDESCAPEPGILKSAPAHPGAADEGTATWSTGAAFMRTQANHMPYHSRAEEAWGRRCLEGLGHHERTEAAATAAEGLPGAWPRSEPGGWAAAPPPPPQLPPPAGERPGST
ncbi:RegA-like protein RlsK [Volvox carteri f. nagariensis]|uniref:RegA-like protein RlsK n=1 Tax=Volvox carteri f. nagariensis TaxID=3068 RepID=D8THE6_VOLCA|nr:RegA-like protein RlsK [Volvox carteri f. nagariensis]EFJ53056.1 RegA-like protein RlsK [Volvox carteri f. nagariensis]|eukprot:XP_002946061.1 RegA-like protein RlsK [Volvox carteri f. nagariensis]